MADEVYEIELRDKAAPKLRDLRSIVEDVAVGMGKADRQLDRMEAGLGDVARSADSAAKGTKNFSTSLIALDSAFGIVQKSAGLARQAFNLFKEPVKFAVDAESGINALRTLSDGVNSELRAQLLALPAEIGQTTQQTLKSAYDALSAGISENRLVDTLREAGKLARAGQGDLTDTLAVLRVSLKAYESAGVDANTVSDVLFATIRKGVTTLPELAGSFGQVAGSAGQYGVSIQETGAALAELTKIAPTTSIAVTQLNALLKAIAAPSAQAQKTLKKLGVEYGISALQAKGLTGVLDDIQRATGGSVEILGTLFQRQEATRGLLTLLADGQRGYRDALDATTNAAGETARANAIMGEGAAGLLKRFEALKERALREIGERLLPKVVEGLERFITYFNSEGIAQLDKYASVLATVGQGFVVVAEAASSAVGALETVGKAIGDTAGEAVYAFDGLSRGADDAGARVGRFASGFNLDNVISQVERLNLEANAASIIFQQYEQIVSGAASLDQIFDSSFAQAQIGALQASVGGLTSVFGPLASTAGVAAGAITGVGTGADAAFTSVIRLGRGAAVLTAELSGVPGAAIAAIAAFDEVARRASRPIAQAATVSPPKPPKPSGAATKDTSAADEERRQREIAAISGRVDRLIERERQEQAKREENRLRLNADARVQAITNEAERTAAALELQFQRERDIYAKAGADLQLLEASQNQRRLEAQKQAADTRLAAQQAEYQASATIAGNIAGLTETLAQGSRRAAGFVALFKGIALASNALSAAVESKLEFARGNILQGIALASASALGFARAATLKSQGRALGATGGGGNTSSAGGGGGGSAPRPSAPAQVSRSDFGGGESKTTVFNVGTYVGGPGGLRELSRQAGPRADRYVNGHSGYIGERP